LRLTVVISSLGIGGAERVATILANAWADAGHAVTLLTFAPPKSVPEQPISPAVEVHALGLAGASGSVTGAIAANLSRITRLRRAILDSRPDAVVSHVDQTNVLTLLATTRARIPVYPVEHIDPRYYPIGIAWSALRRLAYGRATRLVAVSQGVLDAFPKPLRQAGAVIPNPILPPSPGVHPNLASRQIVAMGRLTEQKGFDLLLRAYAEIAERHPDWDLTIWGEGPDRTELEALADSLGIAERLSLPGRTANPEAALCRGSLFVFPSRYEGFGLALAEAMSLGLPVIATDCPSGPADLIRDRTDGLLVPNGDVAALGRAMERLMNDLDYAVSLAARATEVVERFSLDKTLALWQGVLSARP